MHYNFRRFGFVLAIYLIIDFACIAVLMNYEASFVQKNGESVYSFSSMKIYEIIAFLIYKYLLNFPFGVFNYFVEGYMYLTSFIMILNAAFLSNLSFFKIKLKKITGARSVLW